MEVHKAGRLILSIANEPGWTMKVDGEAAGYDVYDGVFLSVPLTEGSHTIELSYRPAGLTAGLIVSLICLLVLLIPLMDMAKKSNTQLICLTGLGGESIYNRFDNIYVLNLIAASLRGGTQYLKAEHKRGKEPDELVTARIEVGDQMELLF